jgi:signal transduction histidine kinase
MAKIPTDPARQLAALEHELELLAYELHDGPIQQLAASLMHLEAFAASLGREADFALDQLALAQQRLCEAADETRRAIAAARPPLLAEAGLSAAVAWLVEEARAAVPAIELDDRLGGARFDPVVEHAACRIVQEALANVCRHSGAKRAKVRLVVDSRKLVVEVRDTGRGFDVRRVPAGRFGLQGIRRRAELLGGKATITSRKGKGTTVHAEVPLE